MPRNVRNFWLSLEVDGKKARVETGPVGKDGGFDLAIRVRSKGEVSTNLVRISGTARPNGKLELKGFAVKNGTIADKPLFSIESER